MAKYRCIYCLNEKDESAFNREHVVPRMMGTYENGFVLSNCEVCEECNSFFSRNLEVNIGLNSMESFLRIQKGKPMSDGRKFRKGRVSFTGAEGLFKGLEFTPVVDSSQSEKLHFEISPKIGILKSETPEEYDYYDLENLPVASTEVLSFLKRKNNAIITTGIPEEIATKALIEKGYLNTNFKYSNTPLSELYDGIDFETKIKYSVDSIIRRVCAKTAFNYLCYTKGREYVLSNCFDDIRNYIRYGTWSDNLRFRYSRGISSTISVPNDSVHIVGFMYEQKADAWLLLGNITWFGELTYTFTLGESIKTRNVQDLPLTKVACFDNISRRICEDEAVYVFIPNQ